MRKTLARGLAVTMVALGGLVPLQASSAAAFVGELDVEPEDGGVRIEGSSHRLTATISGVMDVEGHTINFDTDGILATTETDCDTGTDGSCSVVVDESSADGEIRAYVLDAPSPDESPCGVPNPLVPEDCDSAEGIDEAAEEGDKEEPDDTDVVGVEFVAGVLDVEEEESAAAPGGTVELTANVMSTETPPRGLLANVDGEIIEGPNQNQVADEADFECDTDQNGTCVLTYEAGPMPGVDIAQSWLDLNDDPDAEDPTGDETEGDGFEGDASEGRDEEAEAGDDDEPDDTDVVQVDLSASQILILSPASATKPLGAQSALTATVTTGATPNSGVSVAGQVLPGGPHAGTTATCTTGANGQCTLNYAGPNQGTDKFRATVDADTNGEPNEADSTEDVGVAGGTAEPDTTAVSQITWGTPPPPPDDDRCDAAKKKVKKLKKKIKKAKKALKKAKKADSDRVEKKKKKVKKLKKKIKRAKKKRRNRCN